MSPRWGFAHWARCHVVNGTFRSYANLLTKIRSPSRIVGFMEPEGTSFQSASDDRTAKRTTAKMSNGRISFFHQRRAQARNLKLFIADLTGSCMDRSTN